MGVAAELREAGLRRVYVRVGLYSKNTARTCVTALKGASFGELTCARKNLCDRRMSEGSMPRAQHCPGCRGKGEITDTVWESRNPGNSEDHLLASNLDSAIYCR